ncbi:MAG: hypothetical protein AMXMBFR7_47930 [Planctomycetota bacterium]
MTSLEAGEAFRTIEAAGRQHPEFSALRRNFYGAAIRYAHIRAEWALLSISDRADRNESRTAAHDAFISYCNALSQYMSKAGWDTEWREKLGQDRKDLGDFACFVHAFLGLSAR